MTDIHQINWTIQEAPQAEPRDLDAVPSLDPLLAWREPAGPTRPDDYVAEIGPIQTTTDEPVVAKKADDPPKLTVNKIIWSQVGRVTEPGRYMFTFGWLTISADDIAIWEKYPNAAFTLYGTAATPGDEPGEQVGEEFRLGIFELRETISLSEK